MLETPIVIITYKRPETTRRVLERVAQVRPKLLYVASDGPREKSEEEAVLATRRLFDDLDWDCEVHRDFADHNLGLALRVTTALTEAFDRFGELIVLEDDTLPDPAFFPFCSELLERYRTDERMMQIKGTCPIPNADLASPHSYLFSQQASPWGWASWNRVWKQTDWSFFKSERAKKLNSRSGRRAIAWPPVWRKVAGNPELRKRVDACGNYYRIWMRGCDTRAISNSWAGLFALGVVEQDGLVVSPLTNLVSNIGFGSDAVHFSDPEHAMANTESRPLRLPLDHPRTVEVDGDFQRRCARAVDRSFLGRKRLDDKLAIARRRWPVKPRDLAPQIRGDGLSLSFVIEWDNVKLSDLDRARRMFEALVAQLRELEQARTVEAEFIFGFDAGEFDAAGVKAAIEGIWLPLEPTWPLRYVSDTDVDYYQIKNLGARQASGEFVVFLDSDVVPEDGWLSAILDPFSDPRIQVVGGNTYIEPQGIVAKTFAACWFFPLRERNLDLRYGTDFFANNVAFRRSLFDRFPFPQQLGTSRGSCRNLAELLDREGVVGCTNPAAQVAHPPPNGLYHFVIRGLVEGRDYLLQRKHDAYHVFVGHPFLDTWILSSGITLRGIRRIVSHRRDVGLSWPAVPVAAMIWSAFSVARFMGLGLERLRPGLLGRRLSI